MPFSEIDIKEILQKKFKEDPTFDEEEYNQVKAELELISEIVKTRKEKGLTQEEVAEKSGMSQQVISRLENRTYSPSLRNLIKVTNALGIELRAVSK